MVPSVPSVVSMNLNLSWWSASLAISSYTSALSAWRPTRDAQWHEVVVSLRQGGRGLKLPNERDFIGS